MSAEVLLDFVFLNQYEICSVLLGGLKLEGLISFPCGLGGGVLLKLKGNIISDPPPDICSTCGDTVGVSQILFPQSLKHLCQLRAF